MGSHNVQCTPTVPSAGNCWLEDGLERAETCSHTRVLMIVCYYCCVSTEKKYFIWNKKSSSAPFILLYPAKHAA